MASINAGFSILRKRQIISEELIYIYIFAVLEMKNKGMRETERVRNEIVKAKTKQTQHEHLGRS